MLQVSVAVLLDNFVAASARLEREVKEERIQVLFLVFRPPALPPPSSFLHPCAAPSVPASFLLPFPSPSLALSCLPLSRHPSLPPLPATFPPSLTHSPLSSLLIRCLCKCALCTRVSGHTCARAIEASHRHTCHFVQFNAPFRSLLVSSLSPPVCVVLDRFLVTWPPSLLPSIHPSSPPSSLPTRAGGHGCRGLTRRLGPAPLAHARIKSLDAA